MDIAIVTGAETPLGLRLVESLIRQGCRVHGIGNNFAKVTFADPNFIAHAIDLSDLETVTRTASEILEKEQRLHILIHAIDVTPGAAFEKLPVGNLEAVLKIGLLGPVILSRLALPNLLRFRGQLINIIPANKSGHLASAVNALIEGGLREMNTALFDQARNAGLRVTNLILRQNTVLDPNASQELSSQSRIDPEHIARTVERLLDVNETNVPNEITLYPRLSATAETPLPDTALPIDPYNAVVLPPKEYFPPKQQAIPTQPRDRIDRTIPYTDDEMEDKIAAAIEDYEAHPERYDDAPRKEKPRRGPDNQRKEHRNAPAQTDSAAPKEHAPNSGQNEQPGNTNDTNRRKSRRRGGRNRNKNRDQNRSGDTAPAGNQPPRENHPRQDASPAKNPQEHSEPRRDRGKQRRNPDPTAKKVERDATPQKSDQSTPGKSTQAKPQEQVKPAEKPLQRVQKPKRQQASTSSTSAPAPAAPEPKPKAAKKKAAKKAVKKTPAKKAAKKAAKKKAVKKKVAKAPE